MSRYLSGEAVLAHPPSAAYRFTKFLRKNRRPALAVGVVLAACVLGSVGTLWGFVEARQQRDAAETARAEESTQRELAQSNAFVANAATASAQAAEAVATREKRNALAASSSSTLDQAQQVCENGDVVRGLHLMSSALPPAIESGNAPLEEAVRLAIAAWLPQSYKLRGYAPGHHGCSCLSPDGVTLVTGSWSGRIQLWDTRTFQKSRQERYLDVAIIKVAWQPKGDQIAILCQDATLRLWRHGTDFKSAIVINLSSPTNNVPQRGGYVPHGGLSFSPDGAKLLVGALGRSALLIDVAKAVPIGPGFLHGSTHSDAVTISPDGTRVVVGTPNFTARVYDLATAKPLTPVIRTRGDNCCAGISPDGTKFFTAGYHNPSLEVWDMKTGGAVGTCVDAGEPVNSATFSPDGNSILVGGLMAHFQLWDWKTGKSQGMLIPGQWYSHADTPDGTGIVVSNTGGTGIWTLPDRGLVWTSDRLPGLLGGFAIRQDSQELAITMYDGYSRDSDASQTRFLRRYRLQTGEPIQPFLPTRRYGSFITNLNYSLDGKTVYCSEGNTYYISEGNGMTKYDLRENRDAGRIVPPKACTNHGLFSSDGRYRGFIGEQLMIYDTQLDRWSNHQYPNRAGQGVIGFITDTHRVYDCSFGIFNVRNLDEPSPGPTELFKTGPKEIEKVACRADGKALTLTDSVGDVTEYDLTTCRPTGFGLRNIRKTDIKYSVDGHRVFLTDQVGLTSWHIATHKKLGPYLVTGSGKPLGVTPDGDFVITIDDDRRLQCWRVPKPIAGKAEEVEHKISAYTGFARADGNRLGIELKLPSSPPEPPPAVVSDFREIHNAELPALKAWYASLPEKFRPMHLSEQLGSNGKRFDALALDDGTATVYEANLGLKDATTAGALPNFDRRSSKWPQAWQHLTVVAYACDKVYHRHRAWTQGPIHENSWHPLKNLGLGLQQFRVKRQCPIGVIEYGENLYLLGGPDGGLKWELYHGITEAAVREMLADARPRKWRPDLIHRHYSDADKFVLVLVENPKDVPWEYHAGLSVRDFEKRMADGRGHRPHYVLSWVGKADAAVYSGVWVGDLKPRPVTAKRDEVADAVVNTGSGWLAFALQVLADRCRGLVSPDGVIHWHPRCRSWWKSPRCRGRKSDGTRPAGYDDAHGFSRRRLVWRSPASPASMTWSRSTSWFTSRGHCCRRTRRTRRPRRSATTSARSWRSTCGCCPSVAPRSGPGRSCCSRSCEKFGSRTRKTSPCLPTNG